MVRAWTIAIALIVLIPTALAQDVRATLSAQRVFVGDSVDLTIEVATSDTGLAMPPPPRIDNATVDAIGRSVRTAPVTIINGRRIDTGPDILAFTYRVMPRRPGRVRVEPIAVEFPDGSVRRTQPLEFDAVATPLSDDSTLVLGLSRESAVVGQPITLTLDWTLPAGDIRNAAFGGLDGADSLSVHAPPRPTRGELVEFDLWGLPAVGVLDTVRDSTGTPRRTIRVERLIVPQRAGDLVIGPASATYEEVVGIRRDSSLFLRDRRVYERRRVQSNEVVLSVSAPPPALDGSVAAVPPVIGPVELDAALSATEVGVGDPLTLTLTMRADEPLERLDPPDIALDPRFAGRFQLDDLGWQLVERGAGVRRFAIGLRVASPEVDRVPSIDLRYFDPDRGGYDTARTGDVPLRVRSTRIVTADDAIGASGRPAEAITPERLPLGLAANHADPSGRQGRDPATLLLSPAGLATVAMPPMLAALAFGLARRRDLESDGPRRRRAASVSARTLARRRSPVDAIARRYVALALDIPEHTVTADDVGRLGPDTAHLRHALASGEAHRFDAVADQGPSSTDLMREIARLTRSSGP